MLGTDPRDPDTDDDGLDDNIFDGHATTPGREVLADEDQRGDRNGTIPYRDRLVIRGLLQNVIGMPAEEYRDPDHRRFSRTGWTKYDASDLRRNEFLPPHFAEQLEREGFATSPKDI